MATAAMRAGGSWRNSSASGSKRATPGSSNASASGCSAIVVADGAYHGGLLYFGHGGEALLAPFDFRRTTYNDVDSLASAIDGRKGCRSSALTRDPYWVAATLERPD